MTGNETRSFCVIFDQRAENDEGLRQGVEKLHGLGHSVSIKKIDEPRDVARYAGEAVELRVDTVLAVGGDGMLNLVVNGILREKNDAPCAVGLIPFGTGNDFAGGGGIPVDFAHALDTVIHTEPRLIDVGQVNQTFFVNVAIGGFPAEAVAYTSPTTKKLIGKFAYLATGLANIGSLAAKQVNFSAPGFEWTKRRSMFIDIVRIIISILLPPSGVFLQVGLGKQFWINILLTILGYIPGIVHAVWLITKYCGGQVVWQHEK
jgi:YegS/Rv2252/BmrU family lipid kinase